MLERACGEQESDVNKASDMRGEENTERWFQHVKDGSSSLRTR